MRVRLDGTTVATAAADGPTTDHGAHGFSASFAAPAGSHQVCVSALNTGSGTSAEIALGCAAVIVLVPSPAGPPSGAPAGSYQGLDPARLLDTRIGHGAPRTAVAPQGVLDLAVAGRVGCRPRGRARCS